MLRALACPWRWSRFSAVNEDFRNVIGRTQRNLAGLPAELERRSKPQAHSRLSL